MVVVEGDESLELVRWLIRRWRYGLSRRKLSSEAVTEGKGKVLVELAVVVGMDGSNDGNDN